jgi:hypothetical protein
MEVIRITDRITDIIDILLSYNIAECIVTRDISIDYVQQVVEIGMPKGKFIHFTTVRRPTSGGFLFTLTPKPLTNAIAIQFLKSD